MRKIYLILLLIIIGIGYNTAYAVVPDFASGVGNQNGDPSPSDTVSKIDDYSYQEDQIQIAPNDGVVKVLRTNQKVNVNKFVTELLPLKNAKPRELRNPFRVITRKEGGNADVLQDKEKQEYFLQVVCPEFQLPYLREAAKELDQPWIKHSADGSGELYYQAKFRNITDVVGNLFARDGVAQWYRGPEGYWAFDSLNNSVYFNDQPAVIGLFKKGLSEADIPPNQVQLEVAIYEINLSNDIKMGFDYVAWKNSAGQNLFEFIFGARHTFLGQSVYPPNANPTELDFFQYSGIHALLTAEYVDFLQSKGKAKIVTKGTVLTKSGRVGEIASVDDILNFNVTAATTGIPAPLIPSIDNDETTVFNGTGYRENTDVSVPANQLNIFNTKPEAFPRTVTSRTSGRLGTFFFALPYIGLESMELFACVNVNSITGVNSSGLPVIATRYMDSKVRLKNGEPFVFAGLKKNTTVESTNKIPFFGSIPVLGWLFGNENNTNQETELIVVVTPKFINGAESDLAIPKEAKTIAAQAKGEAELPLPRTALGYDQWLLDSEE